jgi:hypothetical protein
MVRRTLTVLAALFAVAALGTTPAHAGGPTSVLLSSPPYVTAVGYEDQRYSDLQRLTELGAEGSTVSGESHQAGRFVRATWLIHDMSVWRIDIIYPEAPGGPWIATTESLTTGTMPEKPTWHTATDPAALVELIGSLKLLNNPTYDGGPMTTDGQPMAPDGSTPEPAPAAEQPPAAQVQAEPDFFTGWRWTIPGFLVGAVVAVVAIRLLPKRRWELIDTP